MTAFGRNCSVYSDYMESKCGVQLSDVLSHVLPHSRAAIVHKEVIVRVC